MGHPAPAEAFNEQLLLFQESGVETTGVIVLIHVSYKARRRADT